MAYKPHSVSNAQLKFIYRFFITGAVAVLSLVASAFAIPIGIVMAVQGYSASLCLLVFSVAVAGAVSAFYCKKSLDTMRKEWPLVQFPELRM